MRLRCHFQASSMLFKKGRTPLVLSYHGVAPIRDFDLNYRHIDVVEFEYQLKIITKYCNPVSVTDLKNGSFPKNGKRAVALTFDDDNSI